ncbi:MAG: hypothetical protein M3Q83_00120 [Pseudomonadota bacterium]|nr:hypothetical protein [Pseudomonadota bacterium]
MRAFITLALSAVLASTTAMAAAQNQPKAAQDRGVQVQPAATAQTNKPAEPKVCKRLPQGKTCMTAKKWKEFEQMM